MSDDVVDLSFGSPLRSFDPRVTVWVADRRLMAESRRCHLRDRTNMTCKRENVSDVNLASDATEFQRANGVERRLDQRPTSLDAK